MWVSFWFSVQIQEELQREGRSRSQSLSLAIACFLVQLGCDPEARNRKGKTGADIVADISVWECLVSYVLRRHQVLFPLALSLFISIITVFYNFFLSFCSFAPRLLTSRFHWVHC